MAEARVAASASAEGLGHSLPALLIEAERIAETVLQGTHGRRRVGLGESFWQFRSCQPGDPVSRIDWRQSAKTDRLFVRETEWEAAHSLFLWRDASPSMDYASRQGLPTKRERADLLLLALATLALRGGERVGLLGLDRMTMAGTQSGFGRLAHVLNDMQTGDLPPVREMPRHSSAVLFGDFLRPLTDIAASLAGLAAQNVRGVIVQILDPAETTLPFNGRVRFTGMEGEAPELAPRVERLRQDYLDRLAAQQAGLERIAKRAGWRLCLALTTQSPLETLIELHRILSGEA